MDRACLWRPGSTPFPQDLSPNILLGSAAASHPTFIYASLLSKRVSYNPTMGIPAITSIQTTPTQLLVGTMPHAGHRAYNGPQDVDSAIQASKGDTTMNE